ncbi:MAG: sigma 54-interacting transcriptional regulator [Pyrinomonadaceae bacterium]
MKPRLATVAGPLKGTIFALSEEEVSIGRESSNKLCIADRSLSRRHSLIKREGDEFKLSDLESLNGTFVNDVPIKQRTLTHGDRIKVGDSLFLFLQHEGEPEVTSSRVEFDDKQMVTGDTMQMRGTDALYLMARDLSALMKISMTINAIRDLEEIQRKLLELIFEVVPAERGAVLLVGDAGEDFVSVFGLDRQAGPDKTVRVSRTIVKRVLTERVSILSSDVKESEAFSASESLIASLIKSVLAVPLIIFERALGVIYLDSTDVAVRFNQDHLQLVSAVANITAVALENAKHVGWLESENQRLQSEIEIEHNMIGESAPLRKVYQFVAKVAPTDSTVLIRGESGTGKELAARAIHQNSLRAAKAFIAVNCAALTETLLESELFGHEKGAFTGAIAQKKGKIELAEGGTLFLDEIGEIAPTLQAKLLRVLQEREFERVGGTRPIKVDLRLIAATNKDLEEAIKDGSFRQDLYYRLNVVSVTMPPLRERREDIPLLASYFAAKYSKKCKRKVMGINAQTRSLLTEYDWPGNVRELENAIERAVVLGSGDRILPEDLPEAVLEREATAGSDAAASTKYHDAVTEVKKQLILKAVEQAQGNYTEAAKLLGVHPNYLHRLIRNLNLKSLLKK